MHYDAAGLHVSHSYLQHGSLARHSGRLMADGLSTAGDSLRDAGVNADS